MHLYASLCVYIYTHANTHTRSFCKKLTTVLLPIEDDLSRAQKTWRIDHATQKKEEEIEQTLCLGSLFYNLLHVKEAIWSNDNQ